MLTFLGRNGVSVNCTDEELISFGLRLAEGSFGNEDILKWLNSHI
jgi:prophage maintenance system killer protein